MIESVEIFAMVIFFVVAVIFLLAWLDIKVFDEELARWSKARIDARRAMFEALIKLDAK